MFLTSRTTTCKRYDRLPSRRSARLIAVAIGAAAIASPITRADPRIALPADKVEVAILAAEFQPASISDRELMTKAAAAMDRGEYADALSMLQQVTREGYSDENKKALDALITRAEAGVTQRRSAVASFEKGESALAAGKPAEAITEYKAAIDSRYVDAGTKSKAQEQIAVAEAMLKNNAVDNKGVYAAAKEDFKAGRFVEARTKFVQLDTAGFRAPLFEKSAADYVKQIDAKMPAAAAAATPDTVAVTPPVVAPVVAATPDTLSPTPANVTPAAIPADQLTGAARKGAAQDAYKLGKQQYKSGDWAAAKVNIARAQELGYKGGLFEDSPSKLLRKINDGETAWMAKQAKSDVARAQATADQKASADAMAQVTPPGASSMTVPPVGVPATNEGAVAMTPATGIATADGATTPPVAVVPEVTPAPTATVPETLQQTAQSDRVMAEQNAFEARKLVEAGDAAFGNIKYADALEYYTRALAKDPTNQAAVAGKEKSLRETSLVPAPVAQAADRALTDREREIQAQRQEISYRFNNALDSFEKQLTGQKFDEAGRSLALARTARDQNPLIFTREEVDRQDQTLASAQERFTREKTAYDRTAAARASKLQEQNARDRDRAARLERERTVASLIKQSQLLTKQTKYEEASSVVNQILLLDPQNDYAIGVLPLIEDRAQFARQRRYREKYDREVSNQYIEADEKRIPYSDLLIYPSNWPDLSEQREQTVRQERGDELIDQQTGVVLEKKLPEVKFEGVAFSDVIDFLREITGSNLFVDWKALEAAGVAKDTQVTARLRDVKFSKALSTILQDVGGGTVKLGYTVDEGVITISTEEVLNKNLVTRVFDIRDLIVDVPNFAAPEFNITSSNSSGSGSGGGGGGGGGQGLFGGGNGGGNNGGNNNAERPDRQALVDQITNLIKTTVAAESWTDNGGTGSLSELGGQLIVTQTPENQHRLTDLLSKLRETRAIQITIETRFLTVQRNFLEDIGVDFDFQINNLDDRLIGVNLNGANQRSSLGFNQNSSTFTQAASLDTTLPGNLATLLQGSSLSTAFSFIDDFQVNALIRATQASVGTSQVTAPRLTLFNGQTAYVVVARFRAYVSDLTPVTGQGVVGFDPEVSTVPSGVRLQVQATVSSDRKYVTLTLEPQLSQLIQLVNFSVGGFISGAGDLSSTQPFAASAVIQQPETATTEVKTTVSVPDGGTLLLGGQTISGEIEREQGVPVLSKIPFLKRLFTNRGYAKDDQVLLILVKPTIIIQREQEQKQFPLLSSKVGA